MHLLPLYEVELRYTELASLDYGAGGQLFGTMEGSLSGEALRGTLRPVNLAPRRAGNANLPMLRGVLRTDDGAGRTWRSTAWPRCPPRATRGW